MGELCDTGNVCATITYMKQHTFKLTTVSIIVLVVIGLLGFAGWYVLFRSDKTNINTPATTSPSDKSSVTAYAPPNGYSVHKDTVCAYSFAYPKGWSVEKSGVCSTGISSPDFNEELLPQVGGVLRAGASISIDADVTPLNDLGAAYTTPLSSSTMTIDGHEAVVKTYTINPYDSPKAGYTTYQKIVTFSDSDDFESSNKQLTKSPRFFRVHIATVTELEKTSYQAVVDELFKSFRVY